MQQPDPTSRNWAMAAHLAGVFACYVIPLGGVLAPLVIWLVRKDEDQFAAENALEALNFQLTVFLAAAVALALVLVVIGIPLLVGLAVADVVLGVMAAVAASRGEAYRYPFTLRLVKG